MKCLLDTCSFIWLVGSPTRIPKNIRKILQSKDNQLALSDVAIMEIAFKWLSGKLKLPAPPRTWCEEQAEIWDLERLEISREVIYRSYELPRIHPDPFDRLLVASALENGCTIVTPDRDIARYPVAVLW